jgi:cytochrome bd-type quinol oxidase subunit 2
MAEQTLSDDRARGIRRLLMVTAGIAIALALLSLTLLLGGYAVYGGIVLGIAVVLVVASLLALRAVRDRRPDARRLSIVTAILLCVFSLPLMGVWVGLVTVLIGFGLLVVIYAPEREGR